MYVEYPRTVVAFLHELVTDRLSRTRSFFDIHGMQQEEQQVSALTKKYDRCQVDFEALRTREKLLRDEHEKLKLVMSKEKEMLMGKILDFQQQLRLSNQAGDTVEVYTSHIRQLELERVCLENEIGTLKETCDVVETRMHQQEEMTNRFLQVPYRFGLERPVLSAIGF